MVFPKFEFLETDKQRNFHYSFWTWLINKVKEIIVTPEKNLMINQKKWSQIRISLSENNFACKTCATNNWFAASRDSKQKSEGYNDRKNKLT